MGDQDKLLLPLNGKPIVEHVIDRLQRQCGDVYLNLADKSCSDQFTIKVVPDESIGGGSIGPVGGLYTAMKLAQSLGYSHLATAPGDLPFLPDDFVKKLADSKKCDSAVACSAGRLHPVAALWHVKALEKVETFIESGNYKLMSLLETLEVSEIEWVADPDPFFNINTPEDYAIAVDRLKSS